MALAPDILALGEPLIEFMRLPDDGKRVLYEQGFGGDTSNAAIAAARQGARVGYITAVGEDPFGAALKELWAHENVSAETVKTAAADPTGAYFVQPHASGRSFSYARRGSAASLYGPEDLPAAAIAKSRVLHTSALSQAISGSMRAAVRRAAELTKGTDTLFSFDTNLRLNLWSLAEAKAAIEDILPMADIVFPSDDEAEQLTGLTDPDALLDHFLNYGAKIVALKRGADGVIVATPEVRHKVQPAPCNPVDSTGAGDSFAGSFLAYYLETGDLCLAAKRAAKVAAAVVAGFGAVDPIPFRGEIVGQNA